MDAGPHYSFVDSMAMLPWQCRNTTTGRNTRAAPDLDSFVVLQNIRTDVLNKVQTLLSTSGCDKVGAWGSTEEGGGMHRYFPKQTPPAELQRPFVPSLFLGVSIPGFIFFVHSPLESK